MVCYHSPGYHLGGSRLVFIPEPHLALPGPSPLGIGARGLVRISPRSFLGYKPPALKFSALLTEGGAERLELART